MRHAGEKVLQPAFYDRHRIRLEQERNDLQRAIRGAEEQLQLLSAEGDDTFEERSSSDRELLLERSTKHRRRLKMVLRGLERIRDGTFGVCVGCDGRIAAKRLHAIPSVQYCLRCQEQLERERLTQAPCNIWASL